MYFGHYDYDIDCDKKQTHDVFAFWMRIRIMQLKSSKMKKLDRRRIF
jgi:hypothetical protein